MFWAVKTKSLGIFIKLQASYHFQQRGGEQFAIDSLCHSLMHPTSKGLSTLLLSCSLLRNEVLFDARLSSRLLVFLKKNQKNLFRNKSD